MDNAIKNYRRWLSSDKLNADEKHTLELLTSEEIDNQFADYIDFGTGGIRALMGLGTNRLNKFMIHRIVDGYAKYIIDNCNNFVNCSVIIAYDNRYHSKEFALESAKVLSNYCINTFIFESLRPTPELSFAIREMQAFGGIVITASHNPKEYNGFKIYNSHGGQCVPNETKIIAKYIDNVSDEFSIQLSDEKTYEKYVTYIGENIDEKYYEKLINEIPLRKEISKKDFKIIFSPQHGTSYIPVKTVLERLDYTFDIVKSQAYPDPNFTNTLSPNPENPRAYDKSIELAKKQNSDIILTTDPDCDRVGVAVLHKGDYVILTGNQMGSILLQYIIDFNFENNLINGNEIVYNTIVTTSLCEIIAKNYGIKIESTLTGFKYIGEKIHDHKNDSKFLFAYEESYGYLIKDFVRDKDGVQSIILIAEVANYYLKQGLTLVDVLKNIYEKYGYFLDDLKTITYDGADGKKKIQEIMEKLHNISFECMNVKIYEDYSDCILKTGSQIKALTLPKSNLIRYIFDDNSWIAIRPSGTEPKCKFYFCINGLSKSDSIKRTLMIQKELEMIIGAKLQ